MRKISLIPVLALLLANALFGQANNDDLIIKNFDSIANQLYTPEKPGGAILVAKEGRIIYEKAFGKANLELDVDMKVNSVFRIASVTKPFTAVAILKLAEEGKLSLKDDINKYLKDYPTEENKITIENLLTHSSGIFNYTDLKGIDKLAGNDYSNAEFINLFKEKPLNFAPGTKYSYSNSGYFLLGQIIEKVSKKSYGKYLEDEFFKPLGMKDTSLDDPEKITKNRTSGYVTDDNVFQNSGYLGKTFSTSPAGGLQSTVRDLYLWYKAISEGKIISQKSFEKATTLFKLKDDRTGRTGYSWFSGNLLGSNFIRHDGSTMGYYSSVVFFPEEKVFAVALTNCNWELAEADYFAQITHKFAALTLEKDYFSVEKKSAENLSLFEAVYESKLGERRTIIADGSKLYLVQENGKYSPIYFFKNNKYYIPINYETISFIEDKNGKVSSVIASGGEPIALFKTDKKLPKKSLAQSILNIFLESGSEAGINFFQKYKDSNRYYLSEAEMNVAGYVLLDAKKIDEAIIIFKLNVATFRKSSNAYDSLGEGYFIQKNYKLALASYRKSLELFPNNENATKMINQILKILKRQKKDSIN